jgi:hypothetical protein
MYFTFFISILVTVIIIFGVFRLYIFSKSQYSLVCKNCKSTDIERVARNEMAKRFFSMKHLHKYWCRKCGNKFYLKVH